MYSSMCYSQKGIIIFSVYGVAIFRFKITNLDKIKCTKSRDNVGWSGEVNIPFLITFFR